MMDIALYSLVMLFHLLVLEYLALSLKMYCQIRQLHAENLLQLDFG